MAEAPVEAAARVEAVAAEEEAVVAAGATVTVNGSQALVLLP